MKLPSFFKLNNLLIISPLDYYTPHQNLQYTRHQNTCTKNITPVSYHLLEGDLHNLPNPKAIAKKFTFRQFNEQIQQFDAKLKIGGLLILDHCDFLFTATDVFSRYRPLEAAGNYLIRQRPYYGSSNHREADCFASYRVFQKLA